MSAFARNPKHSATVPKIDTARIVGAALHLCIPVLSYQVLYSGYGERFLDTIGVEATTLGDDRANLLFALDTYYAVRWALGCVVMLSGLNMQMAISIGILHFVLHTFVVDVMSMVASSAVPEELDGLDWAAAALAVVAGILQHGSELQRYQFKKDEANRGKLHKSGLFSKARFINHTGHISRDVAALLLCRFWSSRGGLVLAVFYGFGAHMLVTKVTPEGVEHMKKKYGAQYEDYAKNTPFLFIPGIY